MAGKWRVVLLRRADRQLKALPDKIRAACVDELAALADGEFSGAEPLRGHRNNERVKFYRKAYRILYRINRKTRRILVFRIARRDEHTYKGLNPL